jgi:hypothetical protein
VLVIALVMLVIVILAALVVTYVAYPHRGEELPAAPWLGDAMAKAAEAAPTLPTDGDETHRPRAEPGQGADDARHRR